jgi:exopolyphosphatase / guanosine-5'-triphosphate,3'-diphosphate pyrophosphatase
MIGPMIGSTIGVIAAIDCGTNTIRLLIGQTDNGRPVRSLARESRIVRLGQGVDATGRLADEAVERAFGCLDEYASLLAEYPVERIRCCATSAIRDAVNAQVFADGVRSRIGVDPDVLSGEQEAVLAFSGAVTNLRRPHPEPVLVLDVGGGSTELILGRLAVPGAPVIEQAVSLNVGSVRMHERHLRSDPPTQAEIAACASDIDAVLDASALDQMAAASVVGVAGTFLTMAAGALGLTAYDRDAVDQTPVDAASIHAVADSLLAKSVAERTTLGFVSPGRADVIGAGALVVSRVLRRTRVSAVTASEADILDGIAATI